MARIDKAIKAAGGLTRLAEQIKVKPQVVAHWRHRGIPAERVLDVERATNVSRSYLRPDLYPPEREVA